MTAAADTGYAPRPHILRERDAEPILLSRDETRALVAYLDSISLEAAT